MCFSTPDIPEPKAPPPEPNANSEEAKQRRAAIRQAASSAQGRQSTILTSPLGANVSPQNRLRTKLGGM